jgi:hypothetical protein
VLGDTFGPRLLHLRGLVRKLGNRGQEDSGLTLIPIERRTRQSRGFCQASSKEIRDMSFFDLIRQILRTHPAGMTPQQVRDRVKADHPDYYGTESHRRNVEKGHYKDLDHALLAQIYVAARSAGQIAVDRSQKPIKLIAVAGSADDPDANDEEIDNENLERLEAGFGTMYVLGTNLYTKEGEESLKIGITTGSVKARIDQLYTTGVPFRFRTIREYETRNYYELEQALHKLLHPYRINRTREFFREGCLPYVEQIVSIHHGIQGKS